MTTQPPKAKPSAQPRSNQTMKILDFLRENIPGEGDEAEQDSALNEAKRKVKQRKDEPLEPGMMPQYITGRQ